MKTRAYLKKDSLRDRLIWSAIAVVIGFAIGCLLLLFPIHRLGWIVWMGVGLYAIANLLGVDELCSHIAGHCPNCGHLLKAQPSQKQMTCDRCQTKIEITKEADQYWFIGLNTSDKD